jgi:hypothetical protein
MHHASAGSEDGISPRSLLPSTVSGPALRLCRDEAARWREAMRRFGLLVGYHGASAHQPQWLASLRKILVLSLRAVQLSSSGRGTLRRVPPLVRCSRRILTSSPSGHARTWKPLLLLARDQADPVWSPLERSARFFLGDQAKPKTATTAPAIMIQKPGSENILCFRLQPTFERSRLLLRGAEHKDAAPSPKLSRA